ncbi:hypothetical protein PMIN04_009545 [Paraphaeosphaeria minitans]
MQHDTRQPPPATLALSPSLSRIVSDTTEAPKTRRSTPAMAANGGARKAPSASAKNSIIDTDAIRDALPADKKDKVTLKLKKAVPKPSIPGNWKESDASNKDTPAAGSTSPIVNGQEEKTLAGFPSGRPVDDKVDTVQCKHCRRPVLRASAATHIRDCLSKKQEKLKKKKEAKEAKDAALRKEKGEEDDSGKNARKAIKGTVVDGEGAKKGKKRKLEGDEGKPGSKKKKKDEPKPKGAKPKGPVDVEKQCGVALPNGGFCARSLTCKSHSMGLKRAVPGRSLPYDMLLAQYQKKNQAKQQRKYALAESKQSILMHHRCCHRCQRSSPRRPRALGRRRFRRGERSHHGRPRPPPPPARRHIHSRLAPGQIPAPSHERHAPLLPRKPSWSLHLWPEPRHNGRRAWSRPLQRHDAR